MNDRSRKTCRFCLEILNEGEWDKIEETKYHMLNTLLLTLKLDISKEYVMCRECTSKLQNAVNFKSTCLSTEKKIVLHLNSEEDAKTVFKDRWNENACVEVIDVSNGQRVCRFCKKLKELECYSYSQETKKNMFLVDMVQMHIPELPLSIIEELMTCKHCLDSLQNLLNFIMTFSGIEEKINEDDDRIDIEVKLEPDNIDESTLGKDVITNEISMVKIEESCVENDDIAVKDAVGYDYLTDIDNLNLKNEGTEFALEEYQSERYQENTSENEIKWQILYKCIICTHTTRRKDNLKRHMDIHKDRVETEILKCERCPFQTRHKASLTRHMLIHLNPSAFKCQICSLLLKSRSNLSRHMLTHQNPSEIDMYKCSNCSYQAKYKNCLVRHMLTHQSTSGLTMYQCDNCVFQTRHKGSYKYHMQTHQGSARTVYKCESCSFGCIYKYTYIRHMLIHDNPSKVKMYKCEKCPFKTRHRQGISMHRLTHKSPSEVKMYHCDKCPFETKYNGNLKQHRQTHETHSSKIKKYKCEKCCYETRLRSSLSRHTQTHQNSSEGRIVKGRDKKRSIGRVKKT